MRGWHQARTMNPQENGPDLRETLLRSSNVENEGKKHHHKLLRHSGTMDNRNDEPTMKEVERSWRKTFD